MQVCQIAGASLGVGFVIAGPAILILLYGDRYADGTAVIGWLGVMQAARMAKAGPAIVAMSRGDTMNPMLANLFRAAGFVAAIAAAYAGLAIEWIAIAGLFGELLGFVSSSWMLSRRSGIAIAPAMTSASLCALTIAVSFFAATYLVQSSEVFTCVVGILFAMVTVPVLAFSFQRTRQLTVRFLRAPARDRIEPENSGCAAPPSLGTRVRDVRT